MGCDKDWDKYPGFQKDGVGTRCSDLVSCSQDESSEESREGPIVDVDVGIVGPGRGRGRKPTRR